MASLSKPPFVTLLRWKLISPPSALANEAAIPIGEEPGDPSVVGHRVQLDVAASLANVIFQQPASCVECIADILMRMMRLGIAPDHDLARRNFEIDTHPEQVALLAARVLAFDDDAARYDAVEKVLESSQRSRICAATASDESMWRKVI
jgi:hypothetical protein